MPLTKLENLISSKTGRYLYVSPDDFNASDALDNRGNSLTRPFLTIQRAFLEVARFSYVPGAENDRFDQFSIMLFPGNHYIDNRPGVVNAEEIVPFAFNQSNSEWEDNSIVDLRNPNNILYKFNSVNGGATIPRGTSLIGMDLRRTRLHPLYVPDPADKDVGRTTLFNVTGGCYFWQFTILDGDTEASSPLYDAQEKIGKVYSQPNSTVTTIPYYSHHKICNFEYADRDDLGLLYRKIARAFSLFQPTIDDPGEFGQRPQENRIVGPLQDAIRIDSIVVTDVVGTSALDVTVKTKTNHGYYVGQAVAVTNVRSTLPVGATARIPLANDPLTGVFAVRQISTTDAKEFTYRVIGKNAASIGLGDRVGQPITPPDLDTNAGVQAEIDSVESASPYVFNVSIRSTWGICGIHADGSKATGFKSMVIAQYTGVSLQRDDRSFIRYDEFSNTWNQAPLTDAFATTTYHNKGDAFWKDDWRNFHVKASNDAFIQNVSIFAVGFADHFLMESGGDMSITNSNSNFGNTSLNAIGYKGFSFAQDQGGYISHIIPPKKVTTTTKKLQYYTLNQIKSRNNFAQEFDGPNGTTSITTKLYLGHETAIDPLVKPATVISGFRIGAKARDKIYVKLDSAVGYSGSIRSAEIAPSGYRKWNTALTTLSPSISVGISNKDQDAANLIDLNRDFIAAETYGYITRKFPYLLTRSNITITKCRRDVGYVLEAVANDLRVGGNVNSLQAGQSYYVGTELNYINGEKIETLDAFSYARSLAVAAMRNWTFSINNCSTTINQSTITVPSSITTIGVVEGMSVTATVPSGQTNPIPVGSYVREIVSTTQFILGNSNDTDNINATATISASGLITGGVKLNFTLSQGKFTSSSSRNFDAGNLITLNKDFIAEEALNLAKIQYPTTVIPDETKCKRDIKLILDGVVEDLGNFGNAGIVSATESYVAAPIRYRDSKNLILSNRKEIVDKAAAQLAIDYPDFYYGGSGFTNGGDAQTNAYSRYKDAYRLIQQNKSGIVNTVYNALVASGLPNPPPADLEVKCRKDIGLFIDAVSTDLTTLGNSYSIDFTRQYFIDGKVNGKILTFTHTAGTPLILRANRNYSGVATTTTSGGSSATFAITRNASGIVSSVVITTAGFKYAAGNTLTIPGSSIGGVNVADDIIVSVTSVEQAWITGGLQGEEAKSIFAFTTAIVEMKKAINNQLAIKDLTITGDPAPGTTQSGVSVFGTFGNTTNNTDTQSCSNVQATLDTLSSIIYARINQGDLVTNTQQNPSLPPINYGSAPAQQEKCKRDIGIVLDAIAEDLSLGGNYNTINVTKSYFDSTGNTLISNGLTGEIAQSVTAFSTARDICFKAVTNQLNVKDLEIPEGPADLGVAGPNIPNNNSNALLDVRNKISGLFAILITKLQDGSYVYPSLQYNGGALYLAGELDISVYAYRKARDLAILAIRNWRTGNGLSTDPLYIKLLNTVLNYQRDITITSSSAGIPVCADVAYSIATEFDILLGALTNTLPLPPKTFGSNENVERQTPQIDLSITIDTSSNPCASTKDAIIEKMRVVDSIIRNGVDAEPLISQLVNTSSFAQRATLFRIAGSNPHNLETGTPVRLVAIPRIDPVTGIAVDVDKRLVRLPRGFTSNTKYFVIAPGKITAPYDYSSGGATAQFNDNQVFMLATSIENATAGNYIYSSETKGLSPDIQIEVHQYLTDVNYDLHRYTCQLTSSRVFETTTNHIFDTGITGAQIQKVYFYPLEENLVNGTATGAALNTLPAKTSGGRLEISRNFFVGRPATYTSNTQFSIYLTAEDAINKLNAIQFNFPFSFSFQVFANKKRSPFGYDPIQSGWFVRTLLSTNEIYSRLNLNDINRGSSYVNKPPKTPDAFLYRSNDLRTSADKIYRFRYVVPNYRDDVRDPINGFVIKVRTDDTRKLLPQRILLKPIAANDPKDAIFFESGVQNPKRLGLPVSSTQAAITYDPYNSTNKKRIAGVNTESNVSFTIQSAKKVGDYLEMVVFDHGIDVESLKAKRFVTIKVSQPQGGNGEFIKDEKITWYGEYQGSATVHSWFGTEAVEGGQQVFNYLILKDLEGEIDFDEKTQTFFRQIIVGQADVTAEILSRPNFGKQDKKEYLYGVDAANVYTITPGDVITDDAARQYRIVSVEDIEDLSNSYYIYKIDEIQRRIPRQQDGVYYLTAVRGDIAPLPTGSGVGNNFQKFKFSQPISRLYPLSYKNDPLLFQYDGSNDLGGNQNTNIIDPPSAICSADNYIHGSVVINDAKNSLTKEAVLDFIKDPGSGNYTFSTTNVIQSKSGAASSGAEERLIPIAGDSTYPLEQKLYVELRRPSIARAGNHTFEYLGFGPGNYSTGFPARQTVILTSTQDYYAQAKKQDAGIVFYTGINSNGELYIGNKKINAITGEETFVEAIILDEEEEDPGNLGSLVTVFEDPVTFENIITLNAPPNLKNFFNSPVEINVDPEFEGVMTASSLKVVSNPGQRLGVWPGDDDPTLASIVSGDITIDKNRVRAAIFDMNTRGTQRYSFRTSILNNTPNQNTSGLKARFDPIQTLSFGSTSPLSGDMILKGTETGFSGSLGWMYANTFSAFTLNSLADPTLIDITTVELFPNVNVIKLNFRTGKSNTLLGITVNSQIRITGAVGSLILLNGVHSVYNNVAIGYPYDASNNFVYLIASRASEITLAGASPYLFPVNVGPQPNIEIARSNSEWKEVGVIGAEALRTKTDSYGDYRLGINTVSRANSTDWNVGYVTTKTDPRATLDVVGNVFISGRLKSNFSNLIAGTDTSAAFVVAGDSTDINDTAGFRISTVPLGSAAGLTANPLGVKIGINVPNSLLDKNLVISGDARITGDFTFESDIVINGGDISTSSTTFNLANGVNTTILNLVGYGRSVNLFNSATAAQSISIGNSSISQNLSIGNAALTTELLIHSNSKNAIVDIATVVDNNILLTDNVTCDIKIGGAFSNTNSKTLIGTRNTLIAGNLEIGTKFGVGSSFVDISTQCDTVNIFQSSRIVKFANSSSILSIGSIGGFTTVNNSLRVLASANVEGNIILNGGLNAGNIEIQRARFNTTASAHVVGDNLNQNIDFYKYEATGRVIDTQGVALWGATSFLSLGGQIATFAVETNENPLTRSVGTYSFITTTTAGAGAGATFTITVSNDPTKTITLIVNNAGSGYAVNDIVTIPNSSIGSSAGGNLTIKILTVNSLGTNYTLPISTPGQFDFKIGDLLFLDRADPLSPAPNTESYSEILKVVGLTNLTNANDPKGYRIEVQRAQDGTTLRSDHPDGCVIVKFIKQPKASYITSPASGIGATTSNATIGIAEFGGVLTTKDYLRLSEKEFVKVVTLISTDSQSLIINDGGSPAVTTFKAESVTGNTSILGNLGVGTGFNRFTVDRISGNTTVAGTLTTENTLTINGSSIVNTEFFRITNGATPAITTFVIDTATGSIITNGSFTSNGGNMTFFGVDGVTPRLTFNNSSGDFATYGSFSAYGTGTSKFGGGIQIGGAFGSTAFPLPNVNADLTINGGDLTINSGATTIFKVSNTGSLTVAGNGADLTINSGATTIFKVANNGSLTVAGIENYISRTGGREWVYSGPGTITGIANKNYFIAASANTIFYLPQNALMGDMIRIIDTSGSMNYNVSLVVRAPSGVKVQNTIDNTGIIMLGAGFTIPTAYATGGELVVQTPYASFGLVYAGDILPSGAQSGIASGQVGWYLLEV